MKFTTSLLFQTKSETKPKLCRSYFHFHAYNLLYVPYVYKISIRQRLTLVSHSQTLFNLKTTKANPNITKHTIPFRLKCSQT